jgi:hypothetical protein
VHTSTKSQDLRDLKDMLKADDVSPEEARSIKAAIQAVQKDSNKERLVKVRIRLPRTERAIRSDPLAMCSCAPVARRCPWWA